MLIEHPSSYPRFKTQAPSFRKNSVTPNDHVATSRKRSMLTKFLIDFECTNRILFNFTFTCAIAAFFGQILSLCSDEWMKVVEPRHGYQHVDSEDEDGGRLTFKIGYWRYCLIKFTLTPIEKKLAARDDEVVFGPSFNKTCHHNKFFNINEDLTDFGKTCPAILTRIQISAIVHCLSTVISLCGSIWLALGYFRNHSKVLLSTVLFVAAGLAALCAILQFICVIDDEMSVKLKPTLSGDPSPYAFRYSYATYAGAASFLFLQASALGSLFLYLRKYSDVQSKLMMIPGLREKVKALGLLRKFSRDLSTQRNSIVQSIGMSIATHHLQKARDRRRSRSASFMVPTPGEILYYARSIDSPHHSDYQQN